MTTLELKGHLRRNTNFIVELLEKLGCHTIREAQSKSINCALPDGDNPRGVCVLLTDDKLTTICHTRKDYEGGDIIKFVEYLGKLNFKQSVKLIGGICGINYVSTVQPPAKEGCNKFLSEFCSFDDDFEYKNDILDEGYFHQFIQAPHKIFVEDGISAEVQDMMKISYDMRNSRILIPVRDFDGRLVTFKGRTVEKKYKELEIAKYLAYYPYNAEALLFGYSENYFNIMAAGEVIIVEAEKGVMQAMSIGIDNVLAVSKSSISKQQLYKIAELNCDVVLALDKDIEEKHMRSEMARLNIPCKKSIIVDRYDLLTEKQSPFDAGLDVWKQLYETRKIL